MINGNQGFKEVEHTADWELEVWAKDLSNLLLQAAIGMYWLAGVRTDNEVCHRREFKIISDNSETMLVSFLSELLYFIESENLCFEKIELQLKEKSLLVSGIGNPIISLQKEIKAVTYHNLEVRKEPDGLRVRIVFDV